MVAHQQFDKDGWNIVITCSEFRPDGWVLGQPVKYAVSATAEFGPSYGRQKDWISTALLRFPKDGVGAIFDNAGEASNCAKDQLTTRIDSLKR
ncbi:MAG: hypothetical protein JWM68_1815 [Verrucomicrobiales bacterium]|nr:hypothetical protein [Verrucomicrobiales bacterium]